MFINAGIASRKTDLMSFIPTTCPERARQPDWSCHARRITLIYAGFALLWILASDRTVFYLLGDHQNIVWVNIAKGGFFVAVTSVFLWFLMKRMLTGMERSQAELADREDQIRTIYNAVNDGIIIIRPATGKILSANQTACTIFRYDGGAFLALSLSDLAVQDDGWGPLTGEAMLAATADSHHNSIERRCRRSDGSIFWAEVVCLETRLGGGKCLLVTIRDITGRHEAELEIRDSRSQLRALLTHLEQAREDERARISREVHDVLGQLLTGMKMNLKWITQRLPQRSEGNGKLHEKLKETDGFANSILASIQEISHDLRPNILDRLGLVPALRFESGRFTKRAGIACQFNTLLETIRLPTEKQTHVFRIVQELLTNVARHARADMVTINLLRHQSECVITVTDNGIGIPENIIRDPGSLGILGMMERATLLGGELQIKRAQNCGTIATLTFHETPP